MYEKSNKKHDNEEEHVVHLWMGGTFLLYGLFVLQVSVCFSRGRFSTLFLSISSVEVLQDATVLNWIWAEEAPVASCTELRNLGGTSWYMPPCFVVVVGALMRWATQVQRKPWCTQRLLG